VFDDRKDTGVAGIWFPKNSPRHGSCDQNQGTKEVKITNGRNNNNGGGKEIIVSARKKFSGKELQGGGVTLGGFTDPKTPPPPTTGGTGLKPGKRGQVLLYPERGGTRRMGEVIQRGKILSVPMEEQSVPRNAKKELGFGLQSPQAGHYVEERGTLWCKKRKTSVLAAQRQQPPTPGKQMPIHPNCREGGEGKKKGGGQKRPKILRESKEPINKSFGEGTQNRHKPQHGAGEGLIRGGKKERKKGNGGRPGYDNAQTFFGQMKILRFLSHTRKGKKKKKKKKEK